MKDPNTKELRQSPDFPDAFYRVGAKGLYVRDSKVLLCHDFVIRGRAPVWELPGGGLDFHETFYDALRREVKEEMGLEVTWVAEKPTYLWTNKHEKTRGMEWFHSLLVAFRFDVKSLDDLTPTDECREIRFFSKEELQQAVDLNQQIKPLAQLFNPADFV